MTLYVDIIFMENVFMNSIILLATGIILKDSMKIVRNLIGSTIGALYAIIIYVSNIEIYSNIILKILLSFVIVYISFKPANLKSFFKHVVIFYLTSFTFGGVAFALLYFVSLHDLVSYGNGILKRGGCLLHGDRQIMCIFRLAHRKFYFFIFRIRQIAVGLADVVDRTV